MLAVQFCFAIGQTLQAQAVEVHSKSATRIPPPACAAAGIPTPVIHSADESDSGPQKVIVIGFVGGFARGNDQKHPEVQFAESLRNRYGSAIFAGVFANHQGKEALRTILRLLGGQESRGTSAKPTAIPRIILYGHSWGAAETVMFARELERMGLPVFLTIQVDSIAKPGHDDSRIPPNVSNAINLYQSHGPLQGQSAIYADEPARTTIIGNLHMTYEDRTINCNNYPWFARTFNRPHHKIENDPRVWDLAAALVRSAFDASRSFAYPPRVSALPSATLSR